MPAGLSSRMKRLAGKPAIDVVEEADGPLAALAQVRDPRSRFGRRYPLGTILVLVGAR